MRTESLRSVFAILVLGAAVSACGGGGGGSSDSAPTPGDNGSISAPSAGDSNGGTTPNDGGDRSPGSVPDGDDGDAGAPDSDAPGNDGGNDDSDSGAVTNPDQGDGDADSTPPAVDQTALLTWEGSTRNADNSCLEDLAGYRISYGPEVGVYDQEINVDLDKLVGTRTGESDECGEVMTYTYLIDDLPTATWHFAVQAVDVDGNVSDYSNNEQKTVGS